jgi:UDP-glucose 4-epimerase
MSRAGMLYDNFYYRGVGYIVSNTATVLIQLRYQVILYDNLLNRDP